MLCACLSVESCFFLACMSVWLSLEWWMPCVYESVCACMCMDVRVCDDDDGHHVSICLSAMWSAALVLKAVSTLFVHVCACICICVKPCFRNYKMCRRSDVYVCRYACMGLFFLWLHLCVCGCILFVKICLAGLEWWFVCLDMYKTICACEVTVFQQIWEWATMAQNEIAMMMICCNSHSYLCTFACVWAAKSSLVAHAWWSAVCTYVQGLPWLMRVYACMRVCLCVSVRAYARMHAQIWWPGYTTEVYEGGFASCTIFLFTIFFVFSGNQGFLCVRWWPAQRAGVRICMFFVDPAFAPLAVCPMLLCISVAVWDL